MHVSRLTKMADLGQETYDLMIPRNASVGDLLEMLQKKANISDEVMNKVRLYEAHGSKFFKYLAHDYQIMSINEFFVLYAAAFPDEEASTKKVSAFHFDKEPSKVHGVPFQFPLKEVNTCC